MITITVKSDLMEQTQRFKTDRQSIAYLKKVKKMHVSNAAYKAPAKPMRRHYPKWASSKYKKDVEQWRLKCGPSSIKVKIERD